MNLNTITDNIYRRMTTAFVVMAAMFMCFMFPATAGTVTEEPYIPAVTAEYTLQDSPDDYGVGCVMTLDNFTYQDQESVNYHTHSSPVPGQVQDDIRHAPRTATVLSGTNLHTDLDLDALFAGVVDIILKMGLYVGGALAVSGVFQLLLSYYNDQPEGKAAALRLIVVGGALMGMRGLLQLIGLIG